MKPLFKNITKYSDQSYQQFVDFHTNKYNNSYKFYTIIISILFVYCIILNITQKNIGLSLLFIGMLVGYLMMRVYVPAKEYVKNKKRFSDNKSSFFTFTFYKFFFTVDSQRFYYMKLHKVFETKEYFYLYVNEDTAFLVSKNGFKLGNSNDFSEFIKKKCLLKYSKQKEKEQ